MSSSSSLSSSLLASYSYAKPTASHALRAHNRNVPDDVLALLKRNNGLIMICFLPSLVNNSNNNNISGNVAEQGATVSDVADHIVYAGTKIGYAHVGIGSDFDGMLEGPRGLDDVSEYPRLVAELMERGVVEEELDMVCGGNLIRVMRDVEAFVEGGAGKGMEMMGDEVEEVWTEQQRGMVARKGAERVEKRNPQDPRTDGSSI